MRKFFWLSCGGAIVLAAIVIAFVASRDNKKADELAMKFPSWVSVSGTTATFTAKFPTQPQRQTQDLPVPNSDQILRQEVFSVESDTGISYTLFAIVYPIAMGGDEDGNLQTALQGMVKSLPSGATLTSSRMRTDSFGNNKALEFVIDGPSSPHMKGQLRLNGNTLYQIMVNYIDAAVFSDDAYAYFISSFSPQ